MQGRDRTAPPLGPPPDPTLRPPGGRKRDRRRQTRVQPPPPQRQEGPPRRGPALCPGRPPAPPGRRDLAAGRSRGAPLLPGERGGGRGRPLSPRRHPPALRRALGAPAAQPRAPG